jgi:hypothetical protein
MCRRLAAWAAVFDEAVREVVGAGASAEETRESQEVLAPLMASLYLDVARPVLKRFPPLDSIFAGPPSERRA